MELEPSAHHVVEPPDDRLRMDEPPPVRLVSVEDVYFESTPSVEQALDVFYVLLLGFEREDLPLRRPRPTIKPTEADRWPLRTSGRAPIYRSANFRLRFEWVDPPASHDGVRAQGIEVPSLSEVQVRLAEAGIEYVRQRGIFPGQDNILVKDPAGNWLELFESRPV